jgi:hypothetical protein
MLSVRALHRCSVARPEKPDAGDTLACQDFAGLSREQMSSAISA